MAQKRGRFGIRETEEAVEVFNRAGKLLKEAGTEHLIIEDESSRSVEQIPQSVAFIKKVLAEK